LIDAIEAFRPVRAVVIEYISEHRAVLTRAMAWEAPMAELDNDHRGNIGASALHDVLHLALYDTGDLLQLVPRAGTATAALTALEWWGAATRSARPTAVTNLCVDKKIDERNDTQSTDEWVFDVETLTCAMSEEVHPHRAPTTVLYVEDNAANLRLVQRVFERHVDIELIFATEGLAGIALARVRRPALVLLDLNLPDINGDEVLRRLGADPETSTIPVVIVSADPTQIERLLLAGAIAYLTKPLDIRSLVSIVDELIGPAPR
jgi:CheY-like chemotaxis protein